MPDVTLMSGADAAAKLNAAGLNVGSSTSQSSDTVPIGEVISQDPAAGSKVDKGSKVNLVISSGPEHLAVADRHADPHADHVADGQVWSRCPAW